MQVFRTYFKIMKKQMVPILIYAIMFLSMTIIIISNMKVENTDYKVSKVNIMVVNEDGESEFVEGILNYLGQYVNYVKTEEDEEARKDALFYRKVEYILTIPEGFTNKFMSEGMIGLQKEAVPDSTEAISVDSAINNYLHMSKVYLEHVPNITDKDLYSYVANNLEKQIQVSLEVPAAEAVVFSNGFNANYYNYLGYILIATLITGVSIVMFSFQGLDIRRRHSASGISGRNMNLQLLFANLIFVLTYLLLFMAAGFLINKDRVVNANTCMTWLNAIVFSLTVLSISYLVGISVKSRKAVSALGIGLSLSMAFISGIFVPQQYLGDRVLKVASFTPTYWYVKANLAIQGITSVKWNEISGIVGYMAIQIGFAAAIISIALVISKRKRQQAA